jgi:phosphotransferase system enzyme I (PtsI)
MQGSSPSRLIVRGIPVSPGIAIGPAYLMHPERREVAKRLIAPEKVESELVSLRWALDRAQKEIEGIKNRVSGEIGEHEARIFDSHILILRDHEILETVFRDVRENLYSAEYAFYRQMNLLAERFDAAAGGFLKDHMIDLRDVATRVIDILTLTENSLAALELSDPMVILARSLTPSELSQFNPRQTLGLCTEIGGKTSHMAILARSLEIPAVSGLSWRDIRIEAGQTLIVDGNTGVVILNPSLRDIKEYEMKRMAHFVEEEELASLRDLYPVTRDGKFVALKANVELPIEVESVLRYGSEGVGLYRSEFLFLTREDMPSEEEQYEAYRYLADTMAPYPVTIRTLDAGGDKLVPALHMIGERNPYMGWRSIRVCLSNPPIFKTQLRAILRASVHHNVRLMFPMISNLQELRDAKKILEEVREELRIKGQAFDPDLEVGCMIEVPAAVVLAEELAREVDFFSIGTNDLTQFTLAVDRVNERIADLYEPHSPAVLRQIQTVVNVAREQGIPVAVCGEMAADPYMAIVFIGMGIDELSMSPAKLLEMKRLTRNVSYEEARGCAREVLRLSSAGEIDRWLRKRFRESLIKAGVLRKDPASAV